MTCTEEQLDASVLIETHILCFAEPDVTITVGGREFKEYSTNLCCWSGYFNAALNSGMKESTTKQFSFPNRKPQEWTWIMALMAPMPTEHVSKDNLFTALSWFDELSSTRGLQECDRVLQEEIISKLLPESQTNQDSVAFTKDGAEEVRPSLDHVRSSLSTSIRYNLPSSTIMCLQIINRTLNDAPILFGPDQVARLVSIMSSDEESRLAVWKSVELYLPTGNYNDTDRVGMVASPLFPALFLSGLEKAQTAKVSDKILSQVRQVVLNNQYCASVVILNELQNDPYTSIFKWT